MIRLIVVMVLGSLCCQAEAQPLGTVIKSQAIEMGRALVKGDLVTVKQYMHPKMISEAGGEQRATFLADSAMQLFKAMGGQVKQILYGNPAPVIQYKNELQTTLPQTISLVTPFADVEFHSTLVAISTDEGKHWMFIDTTVYREKDIREKLPDLSPALSIPPPQQPKITRKDPQNG